MVGTSALIEWGGVILIAALVFAETGLMLGLVVPGGETLVFTTGLLVSTDTLHLPVWLMYLLLVVCGLAGDISGYFIGRRLGQSLKKKTDTWYFKKKYLYIAENFVQRHKKKSLIIGKFLPIVRPFMPLMAGVSHMRFPVFLLLSVLGVGLYMATFLYVGYFLGERFPVIERYIGWIIPLSIVIALIPVITEIRKHRHDSYRDA